MKSSVLNLEATLQHSGNATGMPCHIDIEAGCDRSSMTQMHGAREDPSKGPTNNATISFSDTATKQLIRNLSAQMVAEEQLAIDEVQLKNAVQDAGQYAFGIAAVEVWVLDDDTGRLVRRVWWRDPTMLSTESLSSLEKDVITAVEVMPGVCIAGVLYAESSSSSSSVYPATSPTTTTGGTIPGEPPKSSSSENVTTTRTHRKTLSQYWQKSAPSVPDPPLQSTLPSQDGMKRLSKELQTNFQQGITPHPSTTDTTASSSSSKCNDANHGEIEVKANSIDVNKSLHGSVVGKRLYWKSYPTTSSGDMETIDDMKGTPRQQSKNTSSEDTSSDNNGLIVPIPSLIVPEAKLLGEESLHCHDSIQPEISNQVLPNDLPKAEHTIRIRSPKKARGNESNGGAFPSSVTFQLDKIFEDKDDGIGNIQPSTNKTSNLTLSNNDSKVGDKPKSTMYSHRKCMSFHPTAVNLESLKHPLALDYADKVVSKAIDGGDTKANFHGNTSVPSLHRRSKSLYWQKDSNDLPTFHILDCLKPPLTDEVNSSNTNNHQLFHFRDIKSLLHDPDTAKTSRLGLLDEAGFSHAAGITFRSGGVEGIVLYYTIKFSTEKTTAAVIDPTTANLAEGGTISIANQVYLLRATELIGAVITSIEARRAVMVMKLESASPSTASVTTVSESSFCAEQGMSETDTITSMDGRKLFARRVRKSLHVWRNKCRGGNLQIPPVMPWEQSYWTFIGVLVSVLLLSAINLGIRSLSGGSYYIRGAPILGPIGAVIALQFGSASAPTAQPRNIILGQLVSGFVVLPFTYIPNWILSKWITEAVGTACAVMAMVKLGVFHPPAGGAALAYSSGAFSFGFFLLMVSVSALFIIPATMINNLSKKRQYPTYWMK